MALEGVHGAGTESMRNDLSLATMLLAVAYIEDAWNTGDKGLVIDAGSRSEKSCGDSCC